MASPNSGAATTQRQQKSSKRSSKPFIPAIPLIPAAKKTVKPGDESSKAELTLNTQGNVTGVVPVVTGPSSVQHAELQSIEDEVPGAHEATKSVSVTETLNGEQIKPVEYIAVLTGQDMAVGDTKASEVENLNTIEHGAVSAQEQIAGDPRFVEAEQPQYKLSTEHTDRSTLENQPHLASPLIIDSSVTAQPREVHVQGDVSVDVHRPYSFQVPPETEEMSTIDANGIRETVHAQQYNMTSPHEATSHHSGMPVHMPSQWAVEQKNRIRSFMPPNQPLQLATSSFSAVAPVFTPASGTPPYSLSSTPAMAPHGLPNMGDFAPRDGLTTPYGADQYASNMPPSFEQTRRQHKARQQVSHAHGDQRNMNGHHQYVHGSGFAGARGVPSFSNDGLFAPLMAHLTALFDSGSLSDWRIIVHNPDKAFEPMCLDVHGAVISRNVALNAYMMQRTRGQSKSKSKSSNEILIEWPDTFIHPSSFNYAIRYIYNEMVLSKEEVERMTFPGHTGSSWRHLQLHFSLSYYLSGYMLGLGSIVKQGRELVRSFIDWQSLETAMNWAVDYRPKHPEGTDTIGVPMSRTTSGMTQYSDQTSSSRSRGAMSGSDSYQLKTSPAGLPLVISQAASSLLLELVVRFLADNVSFESFVLDTSVRTTEMKPRLPVTNEVASGQHPPPNTALQAISFGEFPGTAALANSSQDSLHQNYVTSIAFLNLPSEQLNGLFVLLQRRNDPRAYEFAKQVVADRENLRLQTLRSKSIHNQERENNMSDWSNAGFQEFIHELAPDAVQMDPTGYRWKLEKTWVGLKNPATGTKNKTYKAREVLADSKPQQAGQQQNDTLNASILQANTNSHS